MSEPIDLNDVERGTFTHNTLLALIRAVRTAMKHECVTTHTDHDDVDNYGVHSHVGNGEDLRRVLAPFRKEKA